MENILLDEDNNVKLTDFGITTYNRSNTIDIHGFIPSHNTKGLCCTSIYKPPEQLFNKDYNYSFEADIWAIGMVIYYIYNKYKHYKKGKFYVYDDHMTRLLYDKIKYGKMEFMSNKHVRNLLTKILEEDPTKRITAKEALNYKLFRMYTQYNYINCWHDINDVLNFKICNIEKDIIINSSVPTINDWFLDNIKKYNCSHNSLFNALYMFHKFVSNNIMDKIELKQIAIVCLMISSKIYESNTVLDSLKITTDLDYISNEDIIIHLELKLLRYFNYDCMKIGDIGNKIIDKYYKSTHENDITSFITFMKSYYSNDNYINVSFKDILEDLN